jgi:hypothetical protein
MPRIHPGALALAAVAGASVWISWGVLAITNDHGVRLGMLPPPWMAVAGAAVAGMVVWFLRITTDQAWPLLLTVVLWVPWLPVEVPAAFLAWEGPLEGLLWVMAVGGVTVGRFRGVVLWPPLTNARAAPWIASALMLLCSVGGFAALRHRLPGGDEPHYLVITQSMLLDGDLQIENNHLRGDYHAYHANNIPPDFLRRGVNGQIYSIHAPGVSAIVLPSFAVAGYRGVIVTIAVLCALAVGLMWRTVHLLTVDARASWAAVIATSFSVTYFFHTLVIFPDSIGAVVVAGVVAMLVRCEVMPKEVKRSHFGALGVALGVLPWLHTRFALIAGVAGLCMVLRILQRRDRWRSLAAFVTPPVILAIAWFSYFWIIYGTANPAAPYNESRQNSLDWMLNGTVGLLVDQQFGLVSNAPVLALAPLGLVLMWRTRSRLAIELLAISLPYFAAVSSFAMWWAGWSAPARFLVTLLPLAVLPLAYAWRNGGSAIRSWFLALSVVGIANLVARLFGAEGTLLYNVRNGHDRLLDWASRTVNLPLAMPAVHRWPIETNVLSAAVWIASGVTAVGAVHALSRRTALSGTRLWTLSCGAAIVASATATSASWRLSSASALTSESSEIELLHRWSPETQTVAVSLPALRRLSRTEAFDTIRLHTSNRAADAGSERGLLAVGQVPAGDYDMVVEGAGTLTGNLTVSVGVTQQTIESFSLDRQANANGLTIRLPVQVHSLVIRGDAAARARITDLWLRPKVVVGGASRIRGLAVRASRYRSARIFFMDDAIYMEPGGMWTGGNTKSRLVMTADDGSTSVEVDLRAGPVATTLDASARDWSTRIELAPGEHRRVSLPTNVLLTLETHGAFRPVEHEPGNTDRRQLGVRIEFPR